MLNPAKINHKSELSCSLYIRKMIKICSPFWRIRAQKIPKHRAMIGWEEALKTCFLSFWRKLCCSFNWIEFSLSNHQHLVEFEFWQFSTCKPTRAIICHMTELIYCFVQWVQNLWIFRLALAFMNKFYCYQCVWKKKRGTSEILSITNYECFNFRITGRYFNTQEFWCEIF